jgi:hypothetical protein
MHQSRQSPAFVAGDAPIQQETPQATEWPSIGLTAVCVWGSAPSTYVTFCPQGLSGKFGKAAGPMKGLERWVKLFLQECAIRKKSYVVQMPGQRMRVAYEKA